MIRECLPGVKGMRHLKTGLEFSRLRQPKTRHSLLGIEDKTPYTLDEHSLASELKRRELLFSRLEASVAKAQRTLLRYRSRLKALKEKNRLIFEDQLRRQRRLWDE